MDKHEPLDASKAQHALDQRRIDLPVLVRANVSDEGCNAAYLADKYNELRQLTDDYANTAADLRDELAQCRADAELLADAILQLVEMVMPLAGIKIGSPNVVEASTRLTAYMANLCQQAYTYAAAPPQQPPAQQGEER